MGMANQLGKFSSKLAELSQPLRVLLSKQTAWMWGHDQEKAFTDLKEELSRPTILALYNPLAATKVSADASASGAFLEIEAGGCSRVQKKLGAHSERDFTPPHLFRCIFHTSSSSPMQPCSKKVQHTAQEKSGSYYSLLELLSSILVLLL